MGIYYYTCTHCGEVFPDVMNYVACECGEIWCRSECAEEDGYINTENELDDGIPVEISCKYCRHEDVEDSELIIFLLDHCKLDRAAAVKLLKEKNGN